VKSEGLYKSHYLTWDKRLKEISEAKNCLPEMVAPALVLNFMKKAQQLSLMEMYKKMEEKKIKGYSD